MRKLLYTTLLALGVLMAGSAMADGGSRLKARGQVAKGPAARTPLKRRAAARSHWLLEFATPPGAAEIADMTARGVKVTSRVSGRVLAVVAPDGADFRALRAAPARLDASDKVSPLIASEAGSALMVEFHSDVAPADARALVSEAGLAILEHPDLLPGQLLVAGGPGSAAALAEWDEVAYVFPAAPELVAGERMAGCSGALTEQGLMAQYVKVSEGWGPGPLHYFFESVTGKLDRAAAESETLRALAEWGRYAPLDFTPAAAAGANRTVAILFARGSHGDGFPFDGPGKVLAHTYYPAPPNPEPLAGNMHLDDDEPWRLGVSIDLFSVALHEAGHALGLGHSDRPGSVMYPYYRQAAGLAADDIAGIRELYGSRDKPAAPPEEPPQEPPAKAAVSIAIQQPAAPLTTTAASVAITGRAAGGSGALRVAWRSDRGGQGTASGGNAWSIAAAPLIVGANVITITATDGAGGSASATLSVTRRQDAAPGGDPPPAAGGTPPAIKITSPSLTIVSTSLAAITLRGTASAGTVSVKWTNSTGSAGTAVGTGAWSAEVPLYQGTNTVTVRAYAAGGASGWRSLTVVRR